MDRRAKLRAQRAASRNTQFSIWMQALAQDLERLKQTIDAQLEAATDDAVEDSAG